MKVLWEMLKMLLISLRVLCLGRQEPEEGVVLGIEAILIPCIIFYYILLYYVMYIIYITLVFPLHVCICP